MNAEMRCVGDVMDPEVLVLDFHETVCEARLAVKVARERLVAVTREGRLVGVFSDDSLAESIAWRATLGSPPRPAEMDALSVDMVMTRKPIMVGPDFPIAEADRLMRSRRLRVLPVVDARGSLLGFVHRCELARTAALREHPSSNARPGCHEAGFDARWG